ncbi:potassium channel family protein [Gracilibacillus dipsosauri]|uniref:potassium channel family protein n=1 Tax=Gracilibacillus dipsosauri TaxID=178340 RepID=UPI0024099072
MLWNKWIQFYFHLPIIVRLLLSVCLIMTSFGFIIHILEPIHFPTTFDGIWWAFVTGSTVGYGDYVPLSNIGKIIGILLILAGGGLVTFYMATLSAGTIKHEKSLTEGKISFKGSGHIILIGWNERTKQLIRMMKDKQMKTDIVLIDHSLNKLSYRNNMIHFIHGQPTSDEILSKANIEKAHYIVITADPSLSEDEADRQTILNIIAARGNNPSVHIISEILTEIQQKNALRAGTNAIIRSNDFMSSLIYQALFQKNIQVTDIIAKTLEEQQFCINPIDNNMINQSFYHCTRQFLEDGKSLIGIVREDEIILHPPFSFITDKADQFIFLKAIK